MDAYLDGLEAYAGDRRRRPVDGRQRRQLLHLPRRHRGRPPARRDRHARGARPARQGRRRPGQAGLPPVPRETFTGPRWEALAGRGARVQRPLWASTSTKNPAYPDTLYVDELIGPDTVNTLPDATIEAFADHGTLAPPRRRRRRRRPRRCGSGSPTSASTWTTSPTSSSARAWPASRRASTSCSQALDGQGGRAARRLTSPIEPSADEPPTPSRDAVEQRCARRSSAPRGDRRVAVELLGAALGLLDRPARSARPEDRRRRR